MGKGRSAAKNSHRGTEGIAATSTNIGGAFSAFDFKEDDLLVEVKDRKATAKYAKSPSKKPVRRRKSVDKYDFLLYNAKGATSKQKRFENDELGAVATDCVSQDRTGGTDVGMSVDVLSCESTPLSSLECQSSECTSWVKSSLARGRKPVFHTAGKKHNQVVHLDSDDDERLESGVLGSSINMGGNEGSLKEQTSEFGANSNDGETVVVLAPLYVKYKKNYYRRCCLTFSRKFIKLEGSPLSDRKKTHCVEWPTSDILDIEHQQCESDKAEVIILYIRYYANADETSNSKLGSVEVEFVIRDDPQWSVKQEEIRSLDLKYSASWKTIVAECCFEESFEEVAYPDGDPDAVIISRRDIELLQPRTFINDTIIDFYIRYLLSKTNVAKQRRFHFFNTFFYQKLSAVKQESSKGCAGRDAFRSVLKWTRNVNLFEKDYLFIPVNFSLHWSLIIVCHPGEVVYLRNKDMDESSKVPCILHMDSIRGMHGGLEKLIRSYLWQEWIERAKEHGKEIAEKFLHLNFVSLQLPQQENSFDCGLFLLHYAELFLEQASNCSTTISIDFLNEDWFLPAEVSLKKRDHIRKLIHKLSRDNAEKDPPASSDNKYLKKHGRAVGERSSRSVLKDGGKELCRDINFDSVDDFDTWRQQCFAPMLKQRNKAKEEDQPCKQRVPTTEFNNLRLPLEEAYGMQTHAVNSRYKVDDQLMSPCQLDLFLSGEACRTCSGVAPLGVPSEEDCASDVGFPTEVMQKGGDVNSSTENEEHAACVVEDSEDETQVESFRRRRHFLLN